MALIKPVSQSFLINGQRGRTKGVKINQERYWLKDSQPGFVAGKLHLFGGYYPEQRQISRLDDCTIVELTIQLIDQFIDGFSVLAKPDGSKAFICHGYGKNCNIFDGSGVVKTHSSSYTHLHGGLGYYNGQPTTVGSEYKDGYRKVETLAQGGWISIGDHPKNLRGHNLIGLKNGDLLLIGGQDPEFNYKNSIWRLSSGAWTLDGHLKKVDAYGSAVYVGNSIYIMNFWAIQRIDIAGDDSLEKSELLGFHDEYYDNVRIFNVKEGTCQDPIKPPSTNIMVLPGENLQMSYVINGDGATSSFVGINSHLRFAFKSQPAIVAGQLYIFGGDFHGHKDSGRRIARLDSCKFVELNVKLIHNFIHGHFALSTADGSKAIICFGYDSKKICNVFDRKKTRSTFRTTHPHVYGGLGFYNGQPTTVGGMNQNGQVETLGKDGWTQLANFPKPLYGHNLIGLKNGDMLLIAGTTPFLDDDKNRILTDSIWNLRNGIWTVYGTLKQKVAFGSSLYVEASKTIYVFAGEKNDKNEWPLQRIDLEEDESFKKSEYIYRSHRFYHYNPIMLQVEANPCQSYTSDKFYWMDKYGLTEYRDEYRDYYDVS
ncbi:unnamed protein product, partial [Oikopleura dioica]